MDHTLPAAFALAPEQPVSRDVAPYAGLFLKRHTLPRAGAYVGQHAHAYDHLTVLASGSLRAWRDGELLGDFRAPAELRIPAGSKHNFQALTDAVTFYCVHAVATYAETERAELPGIPTGCGSCTACAA